MTSASYKQMESLRLLEASYKLSLENVKKFQKEMILEVLLIFPLYAGIFVLFFRFRRIIKAMTEIDEIFSALSSEDDDKRDFLVEKIKNGETISNSKTPWTVERLEKASDKVVDKLYEKYVNPPPVKVNKQDALEMGKPVCPVVIEMYAEGLKTLMEQMPYVSSRYTINTEKLKASIASDKYFCDNLAIKIGSKMIEQMGENSVARVGVLLAAKTWDAIEVKKSVINERIAGKNLLSAGEPLEGAEGDNRA